MAHAVGPPLRTTTGTIVAVCAPNQLAETQTVLQALHRRAAVRPILVTLGDVTQPPVREAEDVAIIDGLLPRYLNNLVAARRLSSLPALAWWRGGDPRVLGELAPLVDRLVLDSQKPRPDWRAAAPLVTITAVGDLRWTRLTRWRNLMAQFFDVPDVRAHAADFSTLEIVASDEDSARLFAAWLTTRLPTRDALDVRITPGPHVLTAVSLSGPVHRLDLRLTTAATCVQTSITGIDAAASTRTVSLGNQSPAALLEEEMRIRARDSAFEDALRSVAEAA